MDNNNTNDTESSPTVRNAMRFFHQEVQIKELETHLAQATLALEEIMKWWGEDASRVQEPHFVTATRDALAAIRKVKP